MHLADAVTLSQYLAGAGATAGFCQYLLSPEPFNIRQAVGRAGATAVLSLSAFALPLIGNVFDAHVNFWVTLGTGCALGTIGTERVVRVIDIKSRRKNE